MPTYAVFSMDQPLCATIIEGMVKFVAPYDSFFDYLHQGKGSAYESRAYFSPTYEDALNEFDASIMKTGDVHHSFLEGVEHFKTVRGVKYYRFITGS